MRRITDPQRQVDKFGAGKHGFSDGNPTLGLPATRLNADWFDQCQEEIATVIESSGAVLDGAKMYQLRDAIATMIAAAVPATPNYKRPHVQTAVDFNVTTAMNGYVIEFTGPGNRIAALPSVGSNNGQFVTFIHSGTGTVTLDPAGAETLDGFANRVMRPGDRVTVDAGIGGWLTLPGSRYSFSPPPFTYVLSTAFAFAHGLGETPTRLGAWMINKTTEFGWQPADRHWISDVRLGQEYGSVLAANPTQLMLSTHHLYTPYISSKDGSSDALRITPAKWDIELAAYVEK